MSVMNAEDFEVTPDMAGDMCMVTVKHKWSGKSWVWSGGEDAWAEERDSFMAGIEAELKPPN